MSDDPTGGPPSDETRSTESHIPPSVPPERIGRYRILEKIGEGGMGEVYLAEQDDPRRKVALKVIKWGMDTKQVIARFEAERQALALMDHPNIARVFDAGATETGRPYFVMEHVKGVSILDHCDRHRLTTRERLDLFTKVCEGVQHAHQKAVIHRDIKPSNVLVTLQGDKAVPKIIDFGVAKATAQRLTEKTMFTAMGVMVGTPEYMSPEQADLTGQDVDTRTDVYSLGVMLYQLLTGALPFDPKALRQAGFDEIRRVIREEEPSRPSKRLTTLGDASTESAAKRRTDVTTLSRQLRGDLDWITMKALEKNRARRFQSPSDLASDITRYLRHDPVLASPPSATYRARKFIRRNRVSVSIAGGLVVLLLGFAGTMTYQAARIARERDRADREAEAAERVATFLTDMLGDVDPERLGVALMRDLGERVVRAETDRGATEAEVQAAEEAFRNAMRGVSATDAALRLIDEEILDRAGKTIDEELNDSPLIAARLHHTLGDTYNKLGVDDQVEYQAQRAVEIRQRILGADHPDTLHSRLLYASYMGEGTVAELEDVYATRKRVLGPEHPDTFMAMLFLGNTYFAVGRREEAEQLLLEGIDLAERVLGEESAMTAALREGLAVVYHWKRPDRAEELYLAALDGRRRILGDDHRWTVAVMMRLTLLRLGQNRWEDAETMAAEVVERQSRILGADHGMTLWSMGLLATAYLGQERFEEAEAQKRETVNAMNRMDWGADVGALLQNLACVAVAIDRREIAFRFLREALDANILFPRQFRDRCFDPVRADPEFEAVVAETEARAEARKAQ